MSFIKSFISRLSNLIRGIGKRSFSFKLFIGILSAFVLFIALLAGTMEFTAQNFFCGACHEMREHYYTWKASAHKDVKCVDCHISPGIVNMVKTKVSALEEVYVHFTKDKSFEEIKTGIKAHVPDGNCKKCHTDTPNLIVYHTLKVTHKNHWNRGINCIVCHSRVVHGPRAAYKNTPTMETCRECHDGKKAPDACSTCHVTLGLRAPSTFDPQWVDAHKLDVQQNSDSCKRCHPQDFCNNCHTSAKPHKGDWISIHDKEAQKNPGKCQVCHKERYCTDCHDLRRKHSLNWIDTHKDEAKKDPQECNKCHQESFCSDCHTNFVKHPDGWIKIHGKAKQENRQNCDTCHKENFCSACHTKYKHPDNWVSIHGVAKEENRQNCNMCHKKSFCTTCHGKFKHPANWADNHNKIAKDNPKKCEVCHKKDFCATCHG